MLGDNLEVHGSQKESDITTTEQQEGWDGVGVRFKRGGDMRIPMADSC